MIKSINLGNGPVTVTANADGSINIKTSNSIPWDAKGTKGTRSNFLNEIKRVVPAKARRWNPDMKVWVVAHTHHSHATSIIKNLFNQEIRIIYGANGNGIVQTTVTKTFRMYYLGLPKERDHEGNFGFFAYGHITPKLESGIVFPQQVLEDWFGKTPTKKREGKESAGFNPFGSLGIPPSQWHIITHAEAKRFYRKAARTYHPDLNHEPGAKEKFQTINMAWNDYLDEMLNDDQRRHLFLAGIHFANNIEGKSLSVLDKMLSSYMPPLRCGKVTVQGTESMGRFTVSMVVKWEDIVSGNKILVTYWEAKTNQVEEDWIDA